MRFIFLAFLVLGVIGCATSQVKTPSQPVDLSSMKPMVYCIEDRLASGGPKLEVALLIDDKGMYSVHSTRFEKNSRGTIPAEYSVLEGMDCGVKTNSLKPKSGVSFQLKVEKAFCAQKVANEQRERKEVLIVKNPDNHFYDISEVAYQDPEPSLDGVEIVAKPQRGPIETLGTKLFICELPPAK